MKMKRILTMALSTLMLASALSVPAMAENPTKEVTGTYQADAAAAPVLSMSYSWGDMKFTYSAGTKGKWDPKTHTYSGASSEGAWTCASGSNKVTVVNHSNVAIKVNYKFTAAIAGIDAQLGTTSGNGVIASAEGTEVANAPSKDFYLTITKGALSEGQTNVTLGTLELSYEAA